MRIDAFLVKNAFYKSRTKACEGIDRGEVFVNGKPCVKHSLEVCESDKIEVIQSEKPFVSVGGDKLKRAIDIIIPSIEGKVFIDVGASTGGFTDCLLRFGAKHVFCVDVGENLLDQSLASDSHVTVMDRTNARYLTAEQFGGKVDAIVVDCSFISLEYILPSLTPLLKANGYILALIKPQFELQERVKMKNGILRNENERVKILKRLYEFVISLKMHPQAIVPVTVDKNKNSEYIFYLSVNGADVPYENIIIKGKY